MSRSPRVIETGKQVMKRTHLIIAAFLGTLIVGCGGGGGGPGPIPSLEPSISSLNAPTVIYGTSYYAVGAQLSSLTGVQRVTFSIDGAAVGSDWKEPYGVVVNTTTLGLIVGTHTLTADLWGTPQSSGTAALPEVKVLSTKSQSFQVLPPGGPPVSFAIQQPFQNEVVSGTVASTVSASLLPHQVNFYLDDDWVATDTNAPYTLTWDTSLYANGEHTLTAIGDYGGGVQVGDRVQIQISNGAPAHFIRITSPLDASVLTGNAVVNVATIGTPDRVRFFLDQVPAPVFEDTTAPFQFVLNSALYPDGDYYLSAVASFSEGETLQDVVRVTIQNGGAIKPPETPLIQISNPLNGSAVSSTITVQVNSTTTSYLSEVSFFIDGLEAYTDSIPPFQFTMDTSKMTNGTHTIRILGVFADGSLLGYDTVSITVNNGTHLVVGRPPSGVSPF